MDENFIIELVEEGEKRYGLEIPLAMSLADALNSLKGTLDEVISASDGWKDKDGLKAAIMLEAAGWKEIFNKAAEVAGADELSLVSTVGEGDNAKKLANLAGSGNQVMKHFHVQVEPGDDVLKMFLAFRSAPGTRIISSIDFG